MRQIQKKRTILVRLDHFETFLSPPVSQVTAGFEWLAHIEGSCVLTVCPQKLIDRIEIQLGINHARIILGEIRAAMHQKTFVEALRIRPAVFIAPQMPLADVYCMITIILQEFGNRNLRPGQTHLVEWHAIGIFILNILNQRQRSAIAGIRNGCYNTRHAIGHWRKLESVPGWIPSGHQHCPRRRT